MLKRILCFWAVIAMLLTAAAVAEETAAFTAARHRERGVTCEDCHKEAQPKTPASAEACLTCHKSIEAMAERTKDFERNPHDNHLTQGSDVECTQCHQGHKADTPVCHQCHEGMKFEKKAETKQQNS